MIRIVLLIVHMTIVSLPALSMAENTIYWQKHNWPPYQILHGEDAGKGQVDAYIDLLQKQLPQYEHQNVEMNWSRFWEDVKAGRQVLNSMALKTDEREKFAHFSQAASITLPHRIIMKKSTLEKMGNPESVALADFIQNKNIHGILEQKRSYSSQLDEILNKAGADSNFTRKVIDTQHIFKMILSDRADYTIEYPVVVDYLRKKHHQDEGHSLTSVRIMELPRYVKAHIAAPKTNWGAGVIRDINAVVDRLKTTERYLTIQKMYLSDPRELEEIQSIYEDLFLGKQRTLKISGVSQTITHTIASKVLTEAYKRIGYNVQFTWLPAKRSLILANQGKTDGDIARIEGTEKVFPELIPVPNPIIDFQAAAYAISVAKEINHWGDLKGLKVGVVRGVRYANIGTKGFNPFLANNVPHLFRLLSDGHIDVAVVGRRQAQIELQNNFKKSGIHSVGKSLISTPLHHFVHKKNTKLVALLNEVLAEMDKQGEIESIIDRAFQKLLTDNQSHL